MNPTPAGWPRLSSGVFYRDAAAMIDWLCRAFGFVVRLKVAGDDGRIQHSELTIGGADGGADSDADGGAVGLGVIMVGQERMGPRQRFQTDMASPLSLQGNTQNLMLYVDDVDAHCAQARAAGARIVAEPELHDYGAEYWADRSYGALDPEGHLWWVTQRIRG